MLKLNGNPVTLGNFPDGTLLLKQLPGSEPEAVIDWRYESDNELFANDYLDQIQARNEILDEQDRLDSQLDVDVLKDKK